MCIGILILTAGYAVLREREGDAPGDGGGLAENQGMDLDSERIAVLYADIYERVAENSDLGSAELIEQIVEELGGHGVTAIDGDNQTNMVNAGKAEAFVRRQASGESGNLTVIRVLYPICGRKTERCLWREHITNIGKAPWNTEAATNMKRDPGSIRKKDM